MLGHPTMRKTLPALIAVALLALGWWGYHQLTTQPDTPRASGGGSARGLMGGRVGAGNMNTTEPVVQTLRAEFSDRQPALQLYGQTLFGRSWQITSDLGARIEQIHISEGDRVEAGDALVSLDARELERSLSRARAEATELAARIRQERLQGESDARALALEEELLALNEQALSRIQGLAERNLAAAADVEAARRNVITQQQSIESRRLAVDRLDDNLDQLNAQLASLQQDIADLEEDLTLTSITAPETGLVETILVQPGQRISAGTELMVLQSTDSFQVRATLPASRAGLLSREEPLTGVMTWQGDTTELSLQSWGIRNEDGGIPVTFALTSPRPPLLAGQFGTLTVMLPTVESVLALPSGAIYGNNRVYTVDQGDRLQGHTARIVGQDPQHPGERYLVTAPTVADGDRLLTTRLQRPETGLRVQPLRTNDRPETLDAPDRPGAIQGSAPLGGPQ